MIPRSILLTLLALSAGCGSPSPSVPPSSRPPTVTTTTTTTTTVTTTRVPTTTTAPPSSLAQPAEVRERDYLARLREAGVPLSVTGDSEIKIGRGVCAEVAKGNDPEALADDLRTAAPNWTPDNVTAVIRTALATLCP